MINFVLFLLLLYFHRIIIWDTYYLQYDALFEIYSITFEALFTYKKSNPIRIDELNHELYNIRPKGEQYKTDHEPWSISYCSPPLML